MRAFWVTSLVATLLHIAAPREALPVPSVSFSLPTFIDLPKSASRIVLTDLNNDGKVDVVVAYGIDYLLNANGYTVASIFLGIGDGTFGPRSDVVIYPFQGFGAAVGSIAVVDITGDGNADLITSGDFGVTVLLGSGDGGFGSPSVFYASAVRSIRLADLNGDGRFDLIAVADTNEFKGLKIFPGIANGGFGNAVDVPTLGGLDHVAIGDMSGDGVPDLFIGGGAAAEMTLGLGNFTYSPVTIINTFPTSNNVDVDLGDMNGDGRLDLVMAVQDYNQVYIRLGLGNGDFGPLIPVFPNQVNQPRSLSVSDLNRDGILDVVVGSIFTPNVAASIALGRGDGSFESPVSLSAGIGGGISVVADINGDGNLDIAIAVGTRIAVFLSTLPPNQPPTVALTSPAAGAAFTAPAAVNLAAAASDPDGTVTRVEFFQGATKLGEDATAADGFAFTWVGVPAGTYALTARATDNAGAVTTSAAVNLTVNAATGGTPNLPPTVSLVSPADGSLFTPGAAVAVEATAADTDGTVAKVEFFQGTTLLGEAAVAPYRFTWMDAPVGSYTFTARATDNAGAVTTSAPVRVTVGLPDTGGGGGACFGMAPAPKRPGAGGPFLALGLLWGALSAIRASAAQRSAS